MNALNVLVYFGAQNKHGVFWCILGTQNVRAGLKKTIANLFLSVFVFVVDFVLFVFVFAFVFAYMFVFLFVFGGVTLRT